MYLSVHLYRYLGENTTELNKNQIKNVPLSASVTVMAATEVPTLANSLTDAKVWD